jgi:hypothetical protein
MRRTRTVVRCLVALGFALHVGAVSSAEPIPSPSPAASAGATTHAKPSARPRGERLAIASCSRTYFYAWPVRDSAPSVADYPPATNGDAFHVIGDPQLPYGGPILIETTIDVVEPWGAGKHYWVNQDCVNAG